MIGKVRRAHRCTREIGAHGAPYRFYSSEQHVNKKLEHHVSSFEILKN
jgi:hypothetical protein